MKALIFNGSGMILDSELAGIRELLIHLGKEKEMKKQREEYDKEKDKGHYELEILASLYKGVSEKEIKKKCKKSNRRAQKQGVFNNKLY